MKKLFPFEQVLWLIAGVAVLGTSCSGGTDSEPTPTTATETTDPGTPLSGKEITYEPSTMVGVPAVDALLSAVYAQDTSGLLALTRYFSPPCAAAVDSVLPDCPTGAPDGTPVVSALHGACQRDWVAKSVVEAKAADFERYLADPLGIYAIARLTASDRPIAQGGDPPADYLVVLGVRDRSDGLGRAFLVDSQGVVKSAIGCGRTAAALLAEAEASGKINGMLLAPRGS